MKSFKSFIKEETMPFANVRSGGMNIEDSAVRDNINSLLAGMTNGKFVTPYIALERVAKTLANFHIFMPAHSFLEGDSGTAIVPINQYGIKVGMSNAATFVVKGEIGKDFTHGPHVEGEDNDISTKSEITPKYTVYFEYRMSDCGMFEIFCEVVDQDELDEILADLEAELNDEGEELEEEAKLFAPETGTKRTSGSNQVPMTTGVTIPDGLEGESREKMKSKLEKNGLEEEQINELSTKMKARYVKKAEVDKKSAERQADFSDGEAKYSGNSSERKKAFGKEAEWLKSIATKRAKGIAMAKKNMEEETINELSPELVGKVANKRFRQEAGLDKPSKKSQTTSAAKTLARAAKKKWLGSNVGVLKT
jgi:hypothetical protein